ncbi:MAG: class I SAM-dependent methyltransferase [Halioglobus sp.]
MFTAWQSGGGGTTTPALYEVVEQSRSFLGGFARQSLNRPVAAALMESRAPLLIVSGLWGCTVDLPRIADMLGIPTILVIPEAQSLPDEIDEGASAWLKDAIGRCQYVAIDTVPALLSGLIDQDKVVPSAALGDCIERLSERAFRPQRFSYSTYEFLSRDHPLLHAMQKADVRYFEGANSVLDVACGSGIFLDCLRTAGVDAVGVERDPLIAEYGLGMGLAIVNQDAMDYLRTSSDTFDGIYCSHFVEHLPIDVVQELMALLFQRLNPGGRLVLVFPDPESIRSQLLGFWRDPEHVRFYHPELVSSIATVAGLILEGSSYDDQPHTVVGFDPSPPLMPKLVPSELPQPASEPDGWLEKLCAVLGLQTQARASQSDEAWRNWALRMSETLESHTAYLEQLKGRTDKLWQVNATWAWNDNVTLLFKRPDA